jgi:transcriptional regulator with XRE-family HTH domain
VKGAPAFDGGRLRAARKAAGLTLAQVSDRVGVHVTVVANWERGERVPQVNRVGALARVLGVRPGDLTGAAEGDLGSLQQLRVDAGLLQGQVAAQAGLTRTKYAALERGETASISDRDCTALAAAFGVDPAEVRAAQAVSRAAFVAR